MLLQREPTSGHFNIQSYRPGCIRINDLDYSDTVLLHQAQLKVLTNHQHINEIQDEFFKDLAPNPGAIILVGTGQQLQFPKQAWLAAIQQLGVGIEVMDTTAACRTYQILSGDEREVTALLFV